MIDWFGKLEDSVGRLSELEPSVEETEMEKILIK
jgi:hypothetical protein